MAESINAWLDGSHPVSVGGGVTSRCQSTVPSPSTDVRLRSWRLGFGSTYRTGLETVLEAPGDDPARRDPDDGVVEALHDGLAAGVERDRLAAHLHGTGLPWREHILHHQRRPA